MEKLIRTWVVMAAVLVVPSAMGTVAPHISVHAKLTEKFVRSVELPLDKVRGKVARVVYGNSQYGYFESDDFKVGKGKLRVTIIPPGFKFPIEFHVTTKQRRGDRTWMVAKESFRSPLPEAYEGVRIRTKGQFSNNFYLISAALPKSRLTKYAERPAAPDMPMKNKSRFTFLMIVNRFGEIVWTYMPHRVDSHFDTYIYGRPLGRGRYGMVLGKKDGYFSIINHSGRKLLEIDLKNAPKGQQFPMHHDFDIGPDRSLYTLTNKYYFDKKEKKSYLTNMILKVDLRSKKAEVVKDFLDWYQPETALHWVENKEKDRFVTWGEKLADHDFSHANSIRFVPQQGVLVSFKHLDRVIMLSPSMQDVKWSIGRTARDTFRVAGPTAFSHQHAPLMVDEDSMLLFDNGFEKEESRIIQLNLDPVKKKVGLEWEYRPDPPLYSSNRSSAVKLDNGNILALFVDPVIKGKKKLKNSRVDIMLEIDDKTRRDIAAMRFYYMTASPGYRAEPIEVIGTEKFLGRRF